MHVDWKKLSLSVAVPLAVGALAALLAGGMDFYKQLDKPPLAPPGWVFAVVWPVLYVLMGWSCYLVWKAPGSKKKALTAYGLQLAVNFLWPILFFRGHFIGLALVDLAVLVVLVLYTMRLFLEHSDRAADLLIPYILWICFALYLNLGIFLLN